MEMKVEVMDTCITLPTKAEMNKKMTELLNDDRPDVVLFADTAMLCMAAEQKTYRTRLSESSMLIASQPAIFTRREFAVVKEHHRLVGYEALDQILYQAGKEKLSLYLVGDDEKDIRDFILCVQQHYSDITVRGAYYVSPQLSTELKLSDENIVNEINGHDTDLLVVMMQNPVQEEWINENLTFLRTKICLGIGSVRMAYLYFFRPRHGAANWSVLKKLRYYLKTSFQVTRSRRRSQFQKRVRAYANEKETRTESS